MKRVLLTGASGFIGSHCLPLLLDAGFEVHAVAPEWMADPVDRVHRHTADLLDSDQTRSLIAEVRPSHLLHLAWFVAPGEYWRSTENLRWLQGGLDLAREFADAGGERTVMAGTGAEYATTDRPAVEGVTPLRPTTLYGACKAALHVSSAAYLSERGVGNAWGHIFHPYGPGEHPSRLVPCAIRTLASGQRFMCARPNDVKDFLYVEDVARAFVELLASEVEGDVNIVSGEPISVRELVDRVAMEVGRPDLVDCAASAPEASRYTGEPGRLVREVGWTRRWTVNDGVAATVAWWANRLDDPERIIQDDALG